MIVLTFVNISVFGKEDDKRACDDSHLLMCNSNETSMWLFLLTKIIQVAFPDRRPSRDFNEPIILPSTPTSLGPPASSLQKRRNSFDPKDSDEEEAPEGDWLARLQQRVGSDLTSIRPFDRQASEASGEFSSGGRGLGSRGRGSNRRDSGVPVRINFSIDKKLISTLFTISPLHR